MDLTWPIILYQKTTRKPLKTRIKEYKSTQGKIACKRLLGNSSPVSSTTEKALKLTGFRAFSYVRRGCFPFVFPFRGSDRLLPGIKKQTGQDAGPALTGSLFLLLFEIFGVVGSPVDDTVDKQIRSDHPIDADIVSA